MRGGRQFGFHCWRLMHHLIRRDAKVNFSVYHNYELYANVDDYRAYRIWRTLGSQREKVSALNDSINHSVEKIIVPIKRLDQFVMRLGLSVDRRLVMKIDVEGFEREELVGAEKMLARISWWRALVEFSPRSLANAGKSADQEWAFLQQFQGVVINRKSLGKATLGLLPELAPSQDVDVLIGAGDLPALTVRSGARTAS